VLAHRVIPSLLLSGGGLVKTRRFKDPKYVGDPINAIKIFNDKEVDELLVTDIDASRQKRGPDYSLLEEIAGECFMPLAYGGGIRTVDDAARIFDVGIEKVCVQTAAFERPGLIRALADRFGSQSVMVSVDVKRNWLRKAQLYASATGKVLAQNWLDFARGAVNEGAGELLLNAVDLDGTLEGPDLDLIREAGAALPVPVIAIGGVSSLQDIKAAVDAGASAVAAGAFFVFHGPHRAVLITYPRYTDLEQLFTERAQVDYSR
jgi:imidazole glycerol-phosphate synthase subunit HisF